MPDWTLVGAILLPNAGGWASTLTMMGQVKQPDNKAWYQTIKKPSWNPPNWVFGPAWTVLYTGMGYASYMIYKDCDESVLPLALYGGQLVLNWTWTPVFFRFHRIGLALLHIGAIDVAATVCAISFASVNSHAAYLMVPYLAWLGFATCLNYKIWTLNKDENGDEGKVKK
ncbi:translocator protein isoform X2 [Hyposmocoma kahamanoa]|uniref:translocator protein isoform X2 n=1 Tax=Hyposmocoma kahamanoa TaxID=1477025 RepID=UPI000E6D83C7|nr:translocator protein isoform X2 [Hyposmocoma kahamanoa]